MIDPNNNPLNRQQQPQTLAEAEQMRIDRQAEMQDRPSTMSETFDAALTENFDFETAKRWFTRTGKRDMAYTAKDDPRWSLVPEQYRDDPRLADAPNADTFGYRLAGLYEEMEADRVLANSRGIGGFAAELGAAATDLPAVVVDVVVAKGMAGSGKRALKLWQKAIAMGDSAASRTARQQFFRVATKEALIAGLTGAAITEVQLQATHLNRTAVDSAATMVGSAALGALFGRGMARLQVGPYVGWDNKLQKWERASAHRDKVMARADEIVGKAEVPPHIRQQREVRERAALVAPGLNLRLSEAEVALRQYREGMAAAEGIEDELERAAAIASLGDEGPLVEAVAKARFDKVKNDAMAMDIDQLRARHEELENLVLLEGRTEFEADLDAVKEAVLASEPFPVATARRSARLAEIDEELGRRSGGTDRDALYRERNAIRREQEADDRARGVMPRTYGRTMAEDHIESETRKAKEEWLGENEPKVKSPMESISSMRNEGIDYEAPEFTKRVDSEVEYWVARREARALGEASGAIRRPDGEWDIAPMSTEARARVSDALDNLDAKLSGALTASDRIAGIERQFAELEPTDPRILELKDQHAEALGEFESAMSALRKAEWERMIEVSRGMRTYAEAAQGSPFMEVNPKTKALLDKQLAEADEILAKATDFDDLSREDFDKVMKAYGDYQQVMEAKVDAHIRDAARRAKGHHPDRTDPLVDEMPTVRVERDKNPHTTDALDDNNDYAERIRDAVEDEAEGVAELTPENFLDNVLSGADEDAVGPQDSWGDTFRDMQEVWEIVQTAHDQADIVEGVPVPFQPVDIARGTFEVDEVYFRGGDTDPRYAHQLIHSARRRNKLVEQWSALKTKTKMKAGELAEAIRRYSSDTSNAEYKKELTDALYSYRETVLARAEKVEEVKTANAVLNEDVQRNTEMIFDGHADKLSPDHQKLIDDANAKLEEAKAEYQEAIETAAAAGNEAAAPSQETFDTAAIERKIENARKRLRKWTAAKNEKRRAKAQSELDFYEELLFNTSQEAGDARVRLEERAKELAKEARALAKPIEHAQRRIRLVKRQIVQEMWDRAEDARIRVLSLGEERLFGSADPNEWNKVVLEGADPKARAEYEAVRDKAVEAKAEWQKVRRKLKKLMDSGGDPAEEQRLALQAERLQDEWGGLSTMADWKLQRMSVGVGRDRAKAIAEARRARRRAREADPGGTPYGPKTSDEFEADLRQDRYEAEKTRDQAIREATEELWATDPEFRGYLSSEGNMFSRAFPGITRWATSFLSPIQRGLQSLSPTERSLVHIYSSNPVQAKLSSDPKVRARQEKMLSAFSMDVEHFHWQMQIGNVIQIRNAQFARISLNNSNLTTENLDDLLFEAVMHPENLLDEGGVTRANSIAPTDDERAAIEQVAREVREVVKRVGELRERSGAALFDRNGLVQSETGYEGWMPRKYNAEAIHERMNDFRFLLRSHYGENANPIMIEETISGILGEGRVGDDVPSEVGRVSSREINWGYEFDAVKPNGEVVKLTDFVVRDVGTLLQDVMREVPRALQALRFADSSVLDATQRVRDTIIDRWDSLRHFEYEMRKYPEDSPEYKLWRDVRDQGLKQAADDVLDVRLRVLFAHDPKWGDERAEYLKLSDRIRKKGDDARAVGERTAQEELTLLGDLEERYNGDADFEDQARKAVREAAKAEKRKKDPVALSEDDLELRATVERLDALRKERKAAFTSYERSRRMLKKQIDEFARVHIEARNAVSVVERLQKLSRRGSNAGVSGRIDAIRAEAGNALNYAYDAAVSFDRIERLIAWDYDRAVANGLVTREWAEKQKRRGQRTWKRVYGRFMGIPAESPTGAASTVMRGAEVFRSWTTMTLMGGVVPSSLTDAFNPILSHGFRPWIRTIMTEGMTQLFAPQFRLRSFSGGLTEDTLAQMAYAGEAVMNATRAEKLAGFEHWRGIERGDTAIERGTQKARRGFYMANGMQWWNSRMTMFDTLLNQQVLVRAARDFEAGKLDPKVLARLKKNGITEDDLRAWVAELREHADEVVFSGNPFRAEHAMLQNWQNKDAAVRFEKAVIQFNQQQILAQGFADLPLAFDSAAGGFMFQLKSFMIIAGQRIGLRMVDEMDRHMAMRAMWLLAAGTMVHCLKEYLAGRDPYEQWEKEPGVFIKDVLDRSGVLTLPLQTAEYMALALGTSTDEVLGGAPHPISGRKVVEEVGGPNVGMIRKAADAAFGIQAAVSGGRPTPTQVKATLDSVPGANMMYWSRFMKQFKDHMVEVYE